MNIGYINRHYVLIFLQRKIYKYIRILTNYSNITLGNIGHLETKKNFNIFYLFKYIHIYLNKLCFYYNLMLVPVNILV